MAARYKIRVGVSSDSPRGVSPMVESHQANRAYNSIGHGFESRCDCLFPFVPSVGYTPNRLRAADFFFRAQAYNVHIPWILRPYNLAVGIRDRCGPKNGHIYVEVTSVEIHVPAWYRSYMTYPFPQFFSDA